MKFNLVSNFKPTGDQPAAIAALVDGINQGMPAQTLLGVTGSGKTFTMANVIQNVERPVLVLCHNKTLAAQLYSEFKTFFPNNAVEYFVSYYDYYQPEAFMPSTNTYIEKDLSINEEIEKLRMATSSSLLSGRRDIIVISSVSCLYGMGNPDDFEQSIIHIHMGQNLGRDAFLRMLINALYSRNEQEPQAGNFRVKGDTVDVFLPYGSVMVRIQFWGNEIENISCYEVETGAKTNDIDEYTIYPATLFVTTQERINRAIDEISVDLGHQVSFLRDIGKHLEAKRLYERVSFDLEMIKEMGYCSGIENYSRYFDNRQAGTRPFCLLDFFAKDFLMIIDESHVTIPQIRAMYGGDHSRKTNLVEYGFRLPAALDNRPLKFEEFESITTQTVYVSATPTDYELLRSEGVVVEQLIRPTGLLDPPIDVRPSLNQIDDLMEEIQQRVELHERTLVTTLTKRMAEELTKYLSQADISCTYIHSDVDTLDRVAIMDGLRSGEFDVLVGVNLLREGLDLPEVSLVVILDADKEGFLRSHRSLTQTVGRAARNVNGRVIFYADKITDSMQKTIDETNRRREVQIAYNKENNITPTQITRERVSVFAQNKLNGNAEVKPYELNKSVSIAAENKIEYMSIDEMHKLIAKLKNEMRKAAKKLEFLEAAQYRDQIIRIEDALIRKKEMDRK